jgi:hypothetical protein
MNATSTFLVAIVAVVLAIAMNDGNVTDGEAGADQGDRRVAGTGLAFVAYLHARR